MTESANKLFDYNSWKEKKMEDGFFKKFHQNEEILKIMEQSIWNAMRAKTLTLEEYETLKMNLIRVRLPSARDTLFICVILIDLQRQDYYPYALLDYKGRPYELMITHWDREKGTLENVVNIHQKFLEMAIKNITYYRGCLTYPKIKELQEYAAQICALCGFVQQQNQGQFAVRNGTVLVGGGELIVNQPNEDTIYFDAPIPNRIPRVILQNFQRDPKHRIEKILSDILGEEKERFLMALASSLISTQKLALFLVGCGANGKSVLCEMLRTTFGRENCGSVRFSNIAHNDYALPNLENKILNIASEEGTELLKSLSTADFKGITGNDIIEVEQKYQPRREAQIYATHIFAMNELPEIELSQAVLRRIEIFHCPHIFVPAEEADGVKTLPENKNLLNELTNEDYDYLANLIIHKMKEVKDITKLPIMNEEAKRKKYEEHTPTESIARFLEETFERRFNDYGEPEPGKNIPRKELYELYTAWCKKTGASICGKKRVFEYLEKEEGLEVKIVRGIPCFAGLDKKDRFVK